MDLHSSPTSPRRDTFPNFSNGDVEIVLTPALKLRLHSDVLRGASPKLAELLYVENAAVLSKKALSDGTNIRYRLELVDVSTTLGEDPGHLVVIKLDTNGRPKPTPGTPRASMTLSSHGVDPSARIILHAWQAALGALYGREMRILDPNPPTDTDLDGSMSGDDSDDGTAQGTANTPEDDGDGDGNSDENEGYDTNDATAEQAATSSKPAGTSLSDIITTASTVLQVVDQLEVGGALLAPLEVALLGAEQTLWQSVAAAPLSWIELGARLRSFAIWREAALHVVAGWGDGDCRAGSCRWSEAERAALAPEVRALCERKAARFERWKDELEAGLLAYRHEKLRWDRPPEQGLGKKSHEPDVFYWQAQYLWSQWLAARFREGEGRRARDGGLALYRRVWEGSFCDAVEEQPKVAPLTRSGRQVVAEIVTEMKKDLKEMAGRAMKSTLKLDRSKMQVDSMTPFIFEMEHAPWNKKGAGGHGNGSHHSSKRRKLSVEADMAHVPDEDDELEHHIS